MNINLKKFPIHMWTLRGKAILPQLIQTPVVSKVAHRMFYDVHKTICWVERKKIQVFFINFYLIL